MKLMKLKSPFGSLIVVALLVSLPCLCSEAQARGGGGGRGGGGYSGGSFRGGGGYADGPRGGGVAVGPRGGAVADGDPRGRQSPPEGHTAAPRQGGREVQPPTVLAATMAPAMAVPAAGCCRRSSGGHGSGDSAGRGRSPVSGGSKVLL